MNIQISTVVGMTSTTNESALLFGFGACQYGGGSVVVGGEKNTLYAFLKSKYFIKSTIFFKGFLKC